MKIVNISFNHSADSIFDAIQGMATKELIKEADDIYQIIREQKVADGRETGITSEAIEIILQSIPDECTKEETAVLAALIMMRFERESSNPMASLARLMRGAGL